MLSTKSTIHKANKTFLSSSSSPYLHHLYTYAPLYQLNHYNYCRYNLAVFVQPYDRGLVKFRTPQPHHWVCFLYMQVCKNKYKLKSKSTSTGIIIYRVAAYVIPLVQETKINLCYGYNSVFSVLVQGLLFMWCGALDLQLQCSSIISLNATSIAYSHHTDLPFFIHMIIFIYLHSEIGRCYEKRRGLRRSRQSAAYLCKFL